MPADDVRSALEAEKRRLDEEIRRYPTPIPRCDAQFNDLYERRARIVEELGRLAAQSRQS
jgi:hypothetical protein